MPDRWLTDLAASIADGASVDWPAAEACAADSAERDLVARLKVVETITRGHASTTSAHEPSGILTAWGPFATLVFVGRGTFGDVYRGWDARLDRPVALKLLRRREQGQGIEDSAVIEEARLIARVRHPHVVTVYGADRIDGRVGVWMEFLEGRTLEAELQAAGPFAADAIVSIGIDLSSALAAVHHAGLLHRDVKAQNVIRDAGGRSVLTDFGSGRAFTETPVPDQHLELAGTPLYLAPEVISGAPASPQSEVYSLGVLLYHLATGSFPVRGRTLRDLRDAHDRQVRTTCREAAPALRAGISAVIDRALARDPAARFQSADAMHAALRGALTPARRAKDFLWWAGGLAAAAILVLAWWTESRSAAAVPRDVVTRAPQWRQLGAPWIDSVVVGNPEPNGQWLICVEKTTSGMGRVGRCDPSARNMNAISGIGQVDSTYGALVSSDGARVAYVKPALPRELRSSSIDGSGERVEYRIAPGERICDLASWSWEGDTLAGCVTSADGSNEIVVLSPASPSGLRWPLNEPLNERHVVHISLSRDARSLVYDDSSEPDGRDHDLFVVDLRTREDKPLTSGPADDVAPVWSADSRTVYFATNRNNAWAIWSVRSDASDFGATPVQDLGIVRRVTALGNRREGLVYRLDGDPVEVHTASIDWAGRRLAESALAPISASSAPAWSPDGQRLAYLPFDGRQFTAVGRVSIVDALRGGQPASTLITSRAFKDVALRWSPDGKSMVACCALSGPVRAWLIGVTGADGHSSPPEDVTLPNPVLGVAFARSSAGLFYSTADGIWSHDLSTQVERPIFKPASGEILGGGLEVSPDGSRLAFDSRDSETHQSSIRSVPVDGVKADVLHTSDRTLRLVGWTGGVAPSVIFLQSVTAEPPRWELRSLSLADGTMRVVPFPAGAVRHVRLHPDGRQVAYSIVAPSARLWVLGGLR